MVNFEGPNGLELNQTMVQSFLDRVNLPPDLKPGRIDGIDRTSTAYRVGYWIGRLAVPIGMLFGALAVLGIFALVRRRRHPKAPPPGSFRRFECRSGGPGSVIVKNGAGIPRPWCIRVSPFAVPTD